MKYMILQPFMSALKCGDIGSTVCSVRPAERSMYTVDNLVNRLLLGRAELKDHWTFIRITMGNMKPGDIIRWELPDKNQWLVIPVGSIIEDGPLRCWNYETDVNGHFQLRYEQGVIKG